MAIIRERDETCDTLYKRILQRDLVNKFRQVAIDRMDMMNVTEFQGYRVMAYIPNSPKHQRLARQKSDKQSSLRSPLSTSVQKVT